MYIVNTIDSAIPPNNIPIMSPNTTDRALVATSTEIVCRLLNEQNKIIFYFLKCVSRRVLSLEFLLKTSHYVR
jgi:hypothetical protein